MKISAWHKAQGDHVEWYTGMRWYDRVYKSKVFTFSRDWDSCVTSEDVVCGGTGYSCDAPLPPDVEHIMPDYSLYNITDTAYGFLTRGCPRGCGFCIVGSKEGRKSVKVADLREFWSGQRNIVLNDPNILACSDRVELLTQLKDSRAWVDFNQGLDARMLDEDACRMLEEIKTKEIHFAWDRYEDGGIILPKLRMFAKHSSKPHGHRAIVYTLVNYDTTLDQDLDRIYRLRDIGYWAYVMVYNKPNADKVYKRLQRWVNNRFIFAKCRKFEDYENHLSNKIYTQNHD
jgi:hypothetical protein